jgi:2-polyprenyl-3-methyl-5-hydroxy-6-metoxy-1,4-benzoquinol methylase
VADVACGVGWAAIAIALAYPSVRVDGFDLDESSIELARGNAQRLGVADRVSFQVADGASIGEAGAFDMAVIIEAVHDMAQPVDVLAAVRRLLRPAGALLIADEKTAEVFTADAGEAERLYFGYSLFACLPAVMTERPTAAIGTAIRADTMERIGLEAGFGAVERLDEPALDMLRFYLLTT